MRISRNNRVPLPGLRGNPISARSVSIRPGFSVYVQSPGADIRDRAGYFLAVIFRRRDYQQIREDKPYKARKANNPVFGIASYRFRLGFSYNNGTLGVGQEAGGLLTVLDKKRIYMSISERLPRLTSAT